MEVLILKMGSIFSALFDYIDNQDAKKGHLKLKANPMNLPIPFSSYKYEPQVLGSCNGLLCLGYPTSCLLWNPTTRTHHVIQLKLATEETTRLHHGLGYDELHDDFKLVRVVQFWNLDTEVWVYSLNSGSWHQVVEEANWFVPFGFTDAFVNGALHFKFKTIQPSSVSGEGSSTQKADEFLIVAFDVSKETCKVIEIPDCVEKNSIFDIGVLDKPPRLCMVLKKISEVESFRFLEMREYGDESSWTELFRFDMDDGPIYMRPITYVSKHKQKRVLLLEGEGDLYCYDVESDSFKDMKIKGVDCDDFCEVCVCKMKEGSNRILDIVDVVGKIPDQEAESQNREGHREFYQFL